MPIPDEVFLSHSSADRAFTARLAEVLRDHGIPVWYSDTNIRGAQQWHDEIGAALRRCDWLVVVLTPDAVASKWVKRELLFSLQQDRFDGNIAPILYRSCNHDELSWTLASLQMVDFRRDFHQGCRELLRVWGIGMSGHLDHLLEGLPVDDVVVDEGGLDEAFGDVEVAGRGVDIVVGGVLGGDVGSEVVERAQELLCEGALKFLAAGFGR